MALVTDATGNDLTYRIIGAAMAVHNERGPGYPEKVYERALAIELVKREIHGVRQKRVEVHHNGVPVGLFFLDLWVEDLVVVEIKARSWQLTDDEVAQVITYLTATGAPVGLLFNFGRKALEYRRIFPPRKVQDHPSRVGRYSVKRAERRLTGRQRICNE